MKKQICEKCGSTLWESETDSVWGRVYHIHGSVILSYPVKIECPNCGHKQLLDTDWIEIKQNLIRIRFG